MTGRITAHSTAAHVMANPQTALVPCGRHKRSWRRALYSAPILGAQQAEVPPGALLAKVSPGEHLSSPVKPTERKLDTEHDWTTRCTVALDTDSDTTARRQVRGPVEL